MAMNARSASSALRALRVSHATPEAVRKLTHPKPLSLRPAIVPAYRNYATTAEPDLKTTFKEAIPAKRELLKKVKAMGGKTIGEVKVENTIGGMRYKLKGL
jgi:citrate synthase